MKQGIKVPSSTPASKSKGYRSPLSGKPKDNGVDAVKVPTADYPWPGAEKKRK